MAGNEPVTSPDQRKPTNRKVAYTATILAIITMLAYLLGNHEGRVEDLWLLFTAGVLAIGLAADWLMVRNGLRE